MNHHAPLMAHYARTMMEARSRSTLTPRPERRTTRQAMARRLHRLADRLDGNLPRLTPADAVSPPS